MKTTWSRWAFAGQERTAQLHTTSDVRKRLGLVNNDFERLPVKPFRQDTSFNLALPDRALGRASSQSAERRRNMLEFLLSITFG